MASSSTYRFQPRQFSDQELHDEDYRQLREEELSMRAPHEGLKRIRKMQGKSQAEMADIIHVSRRTYQDFETGKRPIPSDAILALHAAFDCDLHELFTGRSVPISREVRATFVKVALDTTVALLKRYGKKEDGISVDDVRRYATLTAELTPPGKEPELMWLFEMVERDRAGIPLLGLGNELEDDQLTSDY